jgi:hypothetical protein
MYIDRGLIEKDTSALPGGMAGGKNSTNSCHDGFFATRRQGAAASCSIGGGA